MNPLILCLYNTLLGGKILMSGFDKTFVAIWIRGHKCDNCLKVMPLLR